MAENEEKIEYSPEEIQEIERIVNYISQETEGRLSASPISAGAKMDYKERDLDISEEDSDMEFDDEDIAVQEKYEEFPEPEEEEEEEVHELQDITDIIHEIKEKGIEEFPEEISEEAAPEDSSFAEEIKEEPQIQAEEIAEEDLLTILESDTAQAVTEEPSEIDISAIAEELEQQQPEEAEKEPLIDEGLLKEFDEASEETAAEKDEYADILHESKIPEDTLDIDIGEISPPEELHAEAHAETEDVKAGQAEEEFPAIDFEGLEETIVKDEEKAPKREAISTEIHETDLSSDLEKIDEFTIDERPTAVQPDFETAQPFEEDIPVSKKTKEREEEIDLSDSELKRLNKIIQFFHPNLTKIIKDVILNDLLPGPDIRELVDMLLSGRQEEEIKDLLEKKLNRKIDISAVQRRRVLAARPEYTKEGRERQARRLKFTGIFAVAAAIVFVLTIFSYKNIYIPAMAKRNIDEGVRLIKKPGVPVIQKQSDYKKAEEIFRYVNENYIKDYLYGYNAYAKAYFQNKEYDYALEKLNKAYEINGADVDTLNNLGFFYSKVPAAKFEQIKPELQKYYYKKIKPLGPINKQIDVAIDFYKKALNIDPNNISALYGIGNAYTSQGEYLKARQFYENILSVDKESIIGYSGLLNLFIERDAFPEVLSIHSDLGSKEKLSQVPSSLLAKLASYYLGKKRTDEKNIRIDYGIQSPMIKDFDDNPYPAVKNVLDALAERDMDYPPLFVQFARLSKEENNLNLMKRNLLTALEKEPNYFAAHLLLAEYYYRTKDPVEAYKSSKKALQAYPSPPEFTNEDFYYETEKIGTAYAIMGNIFYYSDKVKFRFGDEFEEGNTQEKSDELANYRIAQDKYEKALEENYKSSEIFYNLGKIYYIKGQYDKAAATWLNLYEDFTAQPELIFALGNAFYHQNNLEASKGEYLKVISLFESKADRITQIFPARAEHIKIYQSLSSAYNNLGAVYQIQNIENKSNISYWKAIDYAKKIEKENEFARINMARAFKPGRGNVLPVLDENIADGIDAYKQNFR